MESKIDLEWDDAHVVPEVIHPELDFLFRKMIEVTLAKVNAKPGEMILDIGCGRGTDGIALARQGAVVVGLEASQVMIGHARDAISKNGASMAVTHGVGEHLPFRPGTFDKIMCKGSLDHFLDPAAAIGQMRQAIKPDGQVIIAIANFESLGFKIGKAIYRLMKAFGYRNNGERMIWDIPEDHTYKFDYFNLKRMVSAHLEVEQASGVSLFFGVPWWGSFLAKCPRRMSEGILNVCDWIARPLPVISDVIVLTCRAKT